MEGDRRQRAMARIEAALARIDAASAKFSTSATPEAAPDAMDLVSKNEALREDVAAAMRDLDKLIAEIEG